MASKTTLASGVGNKIGATSTISGSAAAGKKDEKIIEDFNKVDAEFVELYNDEALTVNVEDIEKDISEFIEKQIKNRNIGIPDTSVVINFEVQTIPDFIKKAYDRDSVPFYITTVEFAKILYKMSVYLEQNPSGRKEVKEPAKLSEKELTTDFKKNFYFLVNAASLLFNGNDVKKFYTPETMDFLTHSLLVQSQLCSSRIFSIVLESYAKIFVQQFIAQKECNKIIKNFADQQGNPYQTLVHFLRLVTTISNLWHGNDFAEYFSKEGKDYVQYSHDNIQPELFNTIVDTLTSLCKTEKLTNVIIKHINVMSSEVLNFDNFYEAIVGHADDLGVCEIDRKKLSRSDSLALESVLHFLAAIAKHGLIFSVIQAPRDKSSSAERIKEITTALFQITLSAVPATLKAACFDLIAELPKEYNSLYWNELNSSKLLLPEYLVSNKKSDKNKRGIISEIELVEKPAMQYQLVRAFTRMLASLLKDGAPSTGFRTYHNFLYKYVISNIHIWEFLFQYEKWGLISDIAQCWTNLANYQKEKAGVLYETVFRDQGLIKNLMMLIDDDSAPIETILCVLRLLLILAEDENDKTQDVTILTSVEEQIGWNSNIVFKILKCAACMDRDLQIVSIHLLKKLCLSSPNVVQVVLSKPSARAIDIIKYIINDEEDEPSDEANKNVKCTLLYFLLELGSESYFLRNVCGFDLHDPPISIKNSNCSEGILVTILDKLHLHDTHLYSPVFTSLSLRLILLLCENQLTIAPVLNLLLSSKHKFFNDQLSMLRDYRCQKSTIGCYLQLLARESSSNADAIFTGSTQVAFNNLLTSSGGSENSKRNILILEFIDRIENDNDSVLVANGIKEITISFLSNTHAKEMMKLNHGLWLLGWSMFVSTIMEKILTLSNQETTSILSETAAFAAHSLFKKEIFGEIENDEIIKIFGASLQALICLFEGKQKNARTGIYTIIETTLHSLNEETRNECKKIFYNFEQKVMNALIVDADDEMPILESAAISVAESLIPIATVQSYNSFIASIIKQLEGDWNIYKSDKIAGSFIVKAKCSLLARYIASVKDKALLRVFVEEGICYKLSFEPYWGEIASSYSESTTSNEAEVKLMMGSKVLKLISTLAVANSLSDDTKRHITLFLKKFKSSFVEVLNNGGQTTLIGLEFIADLITLISVVPDLEKSTDNPIIDRIPHVFYRFSQPDFITKALKEKLSSIASKITTKSTETPEKIKAAAEVIVKRLLKACICFLVKRTDYKLVFDPPLVGTAEKKSNENPALSVITSYVTNILSKTKDADVKQIKTISSMCLLIILRHIDLWSREEVNFDVGVIRTQAKIFNENPYSRRDPSIMDLVILKKLVAFASDK